MIVSQAIEEIRHEIHDVPAIEYTDKILIRYINNAIQYVNGILVQLGYYAMIDEHIFRNNDPIPNDFIKFIGQYPVRLAANKVVIGDDAYIPNGIAMRYFKYKPNVTSLTDKLPFDNDAIISIIIQVACVFALNRNEFNVTQDSTLITQITQSLSVAITEE